MRVIDLGFTKYNEALKIQLKHVREVKSDPKKEVLLLTEHYPVYTIGKSGSLSNIIDIGRARSEGIEIVVSDRGGDVFYHGPGQLVAYPILSMSYHNLSIGKYVRMLEQAMINTLREFGVIAHRRVGYPGVWIGKKKIGAVGLRIVGGVTMHGIALNVNPNMRHFSYIVVCGIRDATATSMKEVTGKNFDMSLVKKTFVLSFAELLGVKLE